jgi:hypothetical protein
MTTFEIETRYYCRNPRCRSKLPAPVANVREAFCARGCHSSFNRKRCRVCEGPMARRTERQLICGKRRCRNALRGGQSLWRYHVSSDGIRASKTNDFIDPKVPLKPDRATLIRNAIQTKFFGGDPVGFLQSPLRRPFANPRITPGKTVRSTCYAILWGGRLGSG